MNNNVLKILEECENELNYIKKRIEIDKINRIVEYLNKYDIIRI